MDFFPGKKGRKKSLQNGQPSSQNARNRSGDNFVFCCGPQIDLWTELSVKKWSKNTFLGVWTRFWTLNFAEKSAEMSSRVNISELARSYGKRQWEVLYLG